mmetsp:Transcript_18690/g.29712  ORF Transcript_18690/g.29712 Transcript_18690/m.29712 type:complete len:81 (-) Transcript_18690:381-623(-)
MSILHRFLDWLVGFCLRMFFDRFLLTKKLRVGCASGLVLQIFSQTNFEKKSNRQIAWEEKGGGKKDEGEDASKSACCTAM